MDDHNLANTDDNSLARLMDLAQRPDCLWSAEELGAMLRHQLAAPLEFALGVEGDAAMTGRIARYADIRPPIRTFGDLVFHPHPPVELLELVKEFAKSCRAETEGVQSDELATVLYALGIAAAKTKCDRPITGLDAQGLQHLFDWVGEQPWLDTASRQLLDSAREIATDARP